MNPYPNNFYNNDDDDDDGMEGDQFSADDGFSDGDYDENESESYYSEGSFPEFSLQSPDASFRSEQQQQQQGGPPTGGRISPNRSRNRGGYSTAGSSSFDEFEDSFANATVPSDMNSSRLQHSMLSIDELEASDKRSPPPPPPATQSRAAQYRREFEELIELAENGHKLTADEDDRLYCLELFARNQVGEALTEDERLDLEDWLQEEEEAMAMQEEEAEESNRDRTQRSGNIRDSREEEASESLNGPGDEPMVSPPANSLTTPQHQESSEFHDSAPFGDFSNGKLQVWEEESPKEDDGMGFSQQPGMVESENSSDSKHSENDFVGFEDGGDQEQEPPPPNSPMNEDARPQSPNWSESQASSSRGPSKAKKKRSPKKKKASSDEPQSSPFGSKQSGWSDDFEPKQSPRNNSSKQSDWGDSFGNDPFGGNDGFGSFGGFGGETSNKDGAFGNKSDPFSNGPESSDSALGKDDGFGSDFAGVGDDGFGGGFGGGFGDVKADYDKNDGGFGNMPDPFSTAQKSTDSAFGRDDGFGSDFAGVGNDGFASSFDGGFGDVQADDDNKDGGFGNIPDPFSTAPPKSADSSFGRGGGFGSGFAGVGNDSPDGGFGDVKADDGDKDGADGNIPDPFSPAPPKSTDSAFGRDDGFGSDFAGVENDGSAGGSNGGFGDVKADDDGFGGFGAFPGGDWGDGTDFGNVEEDLDWIQQSVEEQTREPNNGVSKGLRSQSRMNDKDVLADREALEVRSPKDANIVEEPDNISIRERKEENAETISQVDMNDNNVTDEKQSLEVSSPQSLEHAKIDGEFDSFSHSERKKRKGDPNDGISISVGASSQASMNDNDTMAEKQILEVDSLQFPEDANIELEPDSTRHSGQNEQLAEGSNEVFALQDQWPEEEVASRSSSQVERSTQEEDMVVETWDEAVTPFENEGSNLPDGGLGQQDTENDLHDGEGVSGSHGYEKGSPSTVKEADDASQQQKSEDSESTESAKFDDPEHDSSTPFENSDREMGTNEPMEDGGIGRENDGNLQSRSQAPVSMKPIHLQDAGINHTDFEEDFNAGDNSWDFDNKVDGGHREGSLIQTDGQRRIPQNSDDVSVSNMSPVDEWSNLEPPSSGLLSSQSTGVQETGGGESGNFGGAENHVSDSNMSPVDDWSDLEPPPSGLFSPRSIGAQGTGGGETGNFDGSENQVSVLKMYPVDDWSDLEPPPSGLLSPHSTGFQETGGGGSGNFGGAENHVSDSNMSSVGDWSDLEPPPSGLLSPQSTRLQEDNGGLSATFGDIENHFDAPSEQSVEDKSENPEKELDSMNQAPTVDIELSNAANNVDGERLGSLKDGEMGMPKNNSDVKSSAHTERAGLANFMLRNDNQSSPAAENDADRDESEHMFSEGTGGVEEVQTHPRKVQNRKRNVPGWAGLLMQSSRGQPSKSSIGSKSNELKAAEDESQPCDGVDKSYQTGEPVFNSMVAHEPDLERSETKVESGESSGHLNRSNDYNGNEMMTSESIVPKGIFDDVVEDSFGNDQLIDPISNQISPSGDGRFGNDETEDSPKTSEKQNSNSMNQMMPKDDKLSIGFDDKSSWSSFGHVEASDDREQIVRQRDQDRPGFNVDDNDAKSITQNLDDSWNQNQNQEADTLFKASFGDNGDAGSGFGQLDSSQNAWGVDHSFGATGDAVGQEGNLYSESSDTALEDMSGDQYIHMDAAASKESDSEGFSEHSGNPLEDMPGSRSKQMDVEVSKESVDSEDGYFEHPGTLLDDMSGGRSKQMDPEVSKESVDLEDGYSEHSGTALEDMSGGQSKHMDAEATTESFDSEDLYSEQSGTALDNMPGSRSKQMDVEVSKKAVDSEDLYSEHSGTALDDMSGGQSKQMDVDVSIEPVDSKDLYSEQSGTALDDISGGRSKQMDAEVSNEPVDAEDLYSEHSGTVLDEMSGGPSKQMDAEVSNEPVDAEDLYSEHSDSALDEMSGGQSKQMDGEVSNEPVDAEDLYSEHSGTALDDISGGQSKQMDAEVSIEPADSEDLYSEQPGTALDDLSGSQSKQMDAEVSNEPVDAENLYSEHSGSALDEMSGGQSKQMDAEVSREPVDTEDLYSEHSGTALDEMSGGQSKQMDAEVSNEPVDAEDLYSEHSDSALDEMSGGQSKQMDAEVSREPVDSEDLYSEHSGTALDEMSGGQSKQMDAEVSRESVDSEDGYFEQSGTALDDMSGGQSIVEKSGGSKSMVDSPGASGVLKHGLERSMSHYSGSNSSYEGDGERRMETGNYPHQSHRLGDGSNASDDWSTPAAVSNDNKLQDRQGPPPSEESTDVENASKGIDESQVTGGSNEFGGSAFDGKSKVDSQPTNDLNMDTDSQDGRSQDSSASSLKGKSSDRSWDPDATFQIENKDPKPLPVTSDDTSLASVDKRAEAQALKSQGTSSNSSYSEGDIDTWSEIDAQENATIDNSIVSHSPQVTKSRTFRSVSTKMSTASTLLSEISFHDKPEDTKQETTQEPRLHSELSHDKPEETKQEPTQDPKLHSEISFHKPEETKQETTKETKRESKPTSLATMLSTRKEITNDGGESIVSNAQQSIHYLELAKKRDTQDESVTSSKVGGPSKKYQMSEDSIYLGEVFGKSESFFSDYKAGETKKAGDTPNIAEAEKEKDTKKEKEKAEQPDKVKEKKKAKDEKKIKERQKASDSQHSRRSVSRRSQPHLQRSQLLQKAKQKVDDSQHSRISVSRRSQSQSQRSQLLQQEKQKVNDSQHSRISVSRRSQSQSQRSQLLQQEKQKVNDSQHSQRSLSRRSQSQSQRSQLLLKTNAEDQNEMRSPALSRKKLNDGKQNPLWKKAKRNTDRRMLALKSPKKKDKKDKTKPRKPRTQKELQERKKKRRKRRRVKKEAKSPALLAFVASVNSAMLELEQLEEERQDDRLEETSAHQLLNGFDALMGIFLQLSDEIELMSTFAGLKKRKDNDEITPYQALKEVLSFAESLDQLFADLKPIILDCFEEEPDEEMEDMLFRLNSLVDLLCETSHRVGEKQEWNDRAETTYVTLLELMELETLELQCYFEDVDVPEQGISENIYEAWSATGHIEERDALQLAANDPVLFRQICYEVMVSTDQWCPDVDMLMEVCDIDPEILEEEPDPEYLEEEDLAPIPRAAEHILDKINGDPLPRSEALAAILRRILPPRAMTDLTLLDNFTSIRNTLDNPLGLSATNLVAITSAPEILNDTSALGVAGVGKTTLAAMVAEHPDVRRYFIDGVVWIYVGDKELTYSRYTQCLRDLVAQLDFYDGVPLFAELIHTPGECLTKRRRREEGFMIYARDTIVELLEDRSVLIILDDVRFEPDLDWFDFAPMPEGSQDDQGTDVALLVSTRVRDLLPAADTVEVDMLGEDDAIALLIQESGQLSHTLMAESKEARSVVRECANHPLAVKSVGRWLGLKHVTAGAVSSVDEIHAEVVKSMEKILKGGDHSGTDMMYEILSLSLSPAINGEATNIIKYCFAAFVIVFCDKEHISEFAMTEPTPIVPMDMAQLLFETLLEINESALLQEGSLFYAQKKEAAVLIPEALSALGVLKVGTYSDADEDEDEEEQEGDQKFLQVVHSIHHEYGEYLCFEEPALKMLTRDAEQEWNRAFAEASLKEVEKWDENLDDAGHSYVLEMIVSHMIRGAMYKEASDLLAKKGFVRGRLMSLGRECATRRHIKDCVLLSTKLNETRSTISKLEPRRVMKRAYQSLGSQLGMEYDLELAAMEDPRIKEIEISRAHYEIGFSLAENRCWEAAIAHWESSQKLLENALGTVEVVAGIMYNIGVAYAEMNEYEQALNATKQCLRIRGAIHGEQHILYAQTIQKLGDIFMGMSDYNEALESYSWALEVMNRQPTLHRVEIGEIQDHKGSIHRSKGELEESLKCHQEALRSKQMDLGEDHPELFITYQHIGNCLSEQGNEDDAIVHLEEAIRLKELDLDGGAEGESDILTLEGFIHYIERNQEQGLECYEKALQILVTKAPYRKEKIASLLHLIGCVYKTGREHKKAMKLFEESLRARRKVLGYVHLEVASTLFNMAFLYQSRNRLDKALKCLEEALKIRELRIPETETVAMTHAKIGTLCRAIGKMKKAQIEFEKALQLRNVIHGKDHITVASVLQELGDLMDDIGEYDQALSNYVDALDIRRTKLGIDDVAVAETLYSMGYTLHNNDEPDRALVCFDESLSIRKYQLGDNSMEVGDTLNMMGFLKSKRGDLEESLTILWDALRIRKKHKDKLKVAATLNNIGNVHREKEDHKVAVQIYAECLRIRREELGDKHEKVADSLIALGNVYNDMKKNDEAMQAYQEALKILTKVFGERDERVATVLQYMGTMEHRSGNQDRARELFTEFVKIRRGNNAMNDGDYVNVLFTIGNIHKAQKNLAQARQCWTEAYQVFQQLGLEETNPEIAEMMNELLRTEIGDDDKTDQRKNPALAFFEKMAKRPTKDPMEPSKNLGNRQNGKAIQL